MSPELQGMMLDYFTRYDLDGSGTINSNEELKQLCTNLVVKLELDMDVQTIDNHVTGAGNMATLCWEFEAFKVWFMAEFKPNPAWKGGDMSSSDEEDQEKGPKMPRQGTYDLVMVDGAQAITFKLRFHDGDTNKLFTRVCNDEQLGYSDAKTAKGEAYKKPKGLHSISGTFDHTANTCKFTKSYDVDQDASTKEPIFEFEGVIQSHCEITGTWKNVETDPAAQDIMGLLSLPANGNFTMKKRIKDDE